ncbi:MAG TPA: phosphate ABC transporter permease subunit PstC [Spirochaetia bacterium]|nr:phosphate ABC transporter permease subunit PstC [Spirochaetia bacterium]
MERTLLACASLCMLSVLLITVFIFERGLPLFREVSAREFLLGTTWQPTSETSPGYGILGFFVGTIAVSLGALVLAVPLGVACGTFLAELAHGPVTRILRSVVELLAGIPSVVYGFFGVIIICRLLRAVFGGTGYSVLAAALVLAIMTLPTIVSITEAAVRSVPRDHRDASYAIGATQAQTIWRVMLPEARAGIIAAVILGIGRAIGETLAVLMVGGNAPVMPDGPLSMVRTLTMNIITDMGYASGVHLDALFATSMVLFILIMVTNLSVGAISRQALLARV